MLRPLKFCTAAAAAADDDDDDDDDGCFDGVGLCTHDTERNAEIRLICKRAGIKTFHSVGHERVWQAAGQGGCKLWS